jgi:hypothetical protein
MKCLVVTQPLVISILACAAADTHVQAKLAVDVVPNVAYLTMLLLLMMMQIAFLGQAV